MVLFDLFRTFCLFLFFQWSVFSCGHCICCRCSWVLLRQAGIGPRHRNVHVKCPMCRIPTLAQEISYVSTGRSQDKDTEENVTVKVVWASLFRCKKKTNSHLELSSLSFRTSAKKWVIYQINMFLSSQKLLEARENVVDQVTVALNFDLTVWGSGANFLDQPKQRKEKPKQSRISFGSLFCNGLEHFSIERPNTLTKVISTVNQKKEYYH